MRFIISRFAGNWKCPDECGSLGLFHLQEFYDIYTKCFHYYEISNNFNKRFIHFYSLIVKGLAPLLLGNRRLVGFTGLVFAGLVETELVEILFVGALRNAVNKRNTIKF